MAQWTSLSGLKRYGERKLSAMFAIGFAFAIFAPTRIADQSMQQDLSASDTRAVMSLEGVQYRYDVVTEGNVAASCPGPACPLNPEVDPRLLRRETTPIYNIAVAAEKKFWRGTLHLRWDVKVPDFVVTPGDLIAFDFYGIAGKSFRFFVDGVEVPAADKNASRGMIVFDPKKARGSPLTFGFEIIAGRSLAPGLITVGQPFLSPPAVAPKLRASFRGLDQTRMLPSATGYFFVAILAGLGCFFTPFYREIFAFSLFVTLTSWRGLLVNDLASFPQFLSVDFVTVSGIIKCLAVAALYAFSGLYFRVVSRLMWLPVVGYSVLAALCYVSGRYGIGLDLLIFENRSNDFNYSLAYLTTAYYAFLAWRETRQKPWAAFRRNVTAAVGVLAIGLAIGFALRGRAENLNLTGEGFLPYKHLYDWMRYSIQAFISGLGLLIATEWALIVSSRQQVLERFGKVVDPRLMNDIIHGRQNQSTRLEAVTVLFSDLRSFTKMCDVFEPTVVTTALNQYLDVVTTAVKKHGGIVDKFVGDAVMALWGVPEQGIEDCAAAARAAIDVRVGMAQLNQRRAEQGLFLLDAGIGVHCGPAIFGAIGNGIRLDYTVIGSTINVASRMEALSKTYQCDIILSRDVYENIQKDALIEDLGMSEVRGMSKQFGIVKLIGMQMQNNVFVIGSEIFEEATNIRGPGVLATSPVIVLAPDYGNESGAIHTMHKAAG